METAKRILTGIRININLVIPAVDTGLVFSDELDVQALTGNGGSAISLKKSA